MQLEAFPPSVTHQFERKRIASHCQLNIVKLEIEHLWVILPSSHKHFSEPYWYKVQVWPVVLYFASRKIMMTDSYWDSVVWAHTECIHSIKRCERTFIIRELAHTKVPSTGPTKRMQYRKLMQQKLQTAFWFRSIPKFASVVAFFTQHHPLWWNYASVLLLGNTAHVYRKPQWRKATQNLINKQLTRLKMLLVNNSQALTE